VQQLSLNIVRRLACAEGRHIEREWDSRSLTGGYVAMSERNGAQVRIREAGLDHALKAPLRALEELIEEHLVSEDESKRTKGFRLHRLNAEERKRGADARSRN